MPQNPKEMISGILNAIGAMAELNYAYYSAHIQAGFNSTDAWALTESFAKEVIRMAFTPPKGDTNEQ